MYKKRKEGRFLIEDKYLPSRSEEICYSTLRFHHGSFISLPPGNLTVVWPPLMFPWESTRKVSCISPIPKGEVPIGWIPHPFFNGLKNGFTGSLGPPKLPGGLIGIDITNHLLSLFLISEPHLIFGERKIMLLCKQFCFFRLKTMQTSMSRSRIIQIITPCRSPRMRRSQIGSTLSKSMSKTMMSPSKLPDGYAHSFTSFLIFFSFYFHLLNDFTLKNVNYRPPLFCFLPLVDYGYTNFISFYIFNPFYLSFLSKPLIVPAVIIAVNSTFMSFLYSLRQAFPIYDVCAYHRFRLESTTEYTFTIYFITSSYLFLLWDLRLKYKQRHPLKSEVH